MEEYIRQSQIFQKRLGNEAHSKREARYLFFRMACPLMQSKVPRLVNLDSVPKTFIHGNPHLDNYVKTDRGSALMDFDRSRIGPYCWDIIRFLSSLSLRREETDGFIDRKVIDYFLDSYIIHYLHPEIPSRPLKMLKTVGPEKWQKSTAEYLKSNKRWSRKMRDHALPPDSSYANNLLKAFLDARNDNLLQEFKLSEVGLAPGSLGKNHFIFSLVPKNPDSYLDPVLLDIKEVYQEKNTKYFYSPCEHHGDRMIRASKVFADGMEERQGFCTYQNSQYWGRQIPSFAVKVKKFLNLEEQFDFSYSVASELAKGHRKGLLDTKRPELVAKDLRENFDNYYKVSKFLTYELNLAFEATIRKIKLEQAFRSW